MDAGLAGVRRDRNDDLAFLAAGSRRTPGQRFAHRGHVANDAERCLDLLYQRRLGGLGQLAFDRPVEQERLTAVLERLRRGPRLPRDPGAMWVSQLLGRFPDMLRCDADLRSDLFDGADRQRALLGGPLGL